jgi:hypothetical protein
MNNYPDSTPRPWKFDKDWMIIRGPQGQEICAIHAATVEGNTDRVNRNIAWDNAELIEQAPDLLKQRDALREALQAIMDFTDNYVFEMRDKNGKPLMLDFSGYEEAARAALALCGKGEAV